MKNYQYIMVEIESNKIVKWNNDFLLFDTQEEAEEMMEECPISNNVEIRKGIFIIRNSVNYKQIKSTGAYMQIVRMNEFKKEERHDG